MLSALTAILAFIPVAVNIVSCSVLAGHGADPHKTGDLAYIYFMEIDEVSTICGEGMRISRKTQSR